MREGSGRVTEEGKEREGGGEFYMPQSVFLPALRLVSQASRIFPRAHAR